LKVFPPGSRIGILGGGQLGRMTALAAANLGYRTHIFTPEADSPASQVAAATTMADFSDLDALDRFAAEVDVVTLEWENVPVAALRHLASRCPVHPSAGVLEITQHRLHEKDFITAQGIRTAPYHAVPDAATLAPALAALGRPAVLKSACMGYDGKGQSLIMPDSDPTAAWAAVGRVEAILEGFVDFSHEISVIVARGQDGTMALYPAVENRHAHHILDVTIAPAALPPEILIAAADIARTLASALNIVGVLAVEMFVTHAGGLLVNELAPRPHNSGHWTMDACPASQFEQLVRAVCGLPLGNTTPLSGAIMQNLIGEAANDWPRLLAEPGARLHLYGKREVRPGRKMGHVTRLVRRDDLG
jgi:5-(carboxyamino)imidazole ribonucleotide synthase